MKAKSEKDVFDHYVKLWTTGRGKIDCTVEDLKTAFDAGLKNEKLPADLARSTYATDMYSIACSVHDLGYSFFDLDEKVSAEAIVIEKEIRIPGTDIILEAGDRIIPVIERTVSQAELDKIRDGLADFFKKNKDYYYVYVDNKEQAVCVEIDWGDWKHDHAYVNLQVDKYFDSIGVNYMFSEKVTDEDGSDTYSSIHIYHIMK